MSKTPHSGLTVLASTRFPPPKLDPDWDVVCACSFGHYPWDAWERWALDRELDPQVAGQARLLIREWFQHSWAGELKAACGWSDDGRALLEFALQSPKEALNQWEILLRTDGLRGDYRSSEWTSGYLRRDAERLLLQLRTDN